MATKTKTTRNFVMLEGVVSEGGEGERRGGGRVAKDRICIHGRNEQVFVLQGAGELFCCGFFYGSRRTDFLGRENSEEVAEGKRSLEGFPRISGKLWLRCYSHPVMAQKTGTRLQQLLQHEP